jgi:hypothetical protein
MNRKNTKMFLESKNICFVSFAFECRVKFLKYPRSIKKAFSQGFFFIFHVVFLLFTILLIAIMVF